MATFNYVASHSRINTHGDGHNISFCTAGWSIIKFCSIEALRGYPGGLLQVRMFARLIIYVKYCKDPDIGTVV
jgi:hypothetical protein